MLKMAHSSDWHLGKTLHQHPLYQDQREILIQILQLLKEGDFDVFLLAGDIFDRAWPSEKALKLWEFFLESLLELTHLTTFIIAGNHDSATRLSHLKKFCRPQKIHLIGQISSPPTPYKIEKEGQEFHFYPLPFPFPQLLPPKLGAENHSPEKMAEILINDILTQLDKKAVNIFLGHLFVCGSGESDSERPLIGGLGAANKHIFSAFDYTALGHLHRPQQIGERIFYSGSPMPLSFSEGSEQKRMLKIEIDKDHFKWESLPLKTPRPFILLEAGLKDLLSEDRFSKYQNHYLQIHLQENDLIPQAKEILRERFPYLLSVRQGPHYSLLRPSPSNLEPQQSLDPKLGPKEIFSDFCQYTLGDDDNNKWANYFEKVTQEESGQNAP